MAKFIVLDTRLIFVKCEKYETDKGFCHGKPLFAESDTYAPDFTGRPNSYGVALPPTGEGLDQPF